MNYINLQCRFTEYYDANKKRKFKFGEFDCFTFVYEYITDILKIELPAEFEGWKYKNWKTVGDKRRGAETLDKFLCQHLDEKPKRLMVSGDVIFFDSDNDGKPDSLAVSVGHTKMAVVTEKFGLKILKVNKNNVMKIFSWVRRKNQ